MKRDAEAEAADLRLSASGRNGHSQQVNSPTITTTTTDVCGSTSDPVKGGETERGIQNDGEFNLEDEENLKSKGTVPVINGSEGSKDLLQDQTDQKDTYINNNDETTGHDHRDDNYITEGDELKEADHVETQNKRVPFWRKLIAYRPWNSKRSSSDLERKGICGDSCCCFRVKAKPEKELGIQDEENRKSKGTLPVINWSAGSKDSIQDETKSDTYISNYDETTGHERDELKEADLETGNKRVPATFGKQTRKQLRSSHKRRRSLESKERELGDDNHITKGDELKVVDHLETENKRVPSSSDLEGELIAISSSTCSSFSSFNDEDISCSARSRWREPNPGELIAISSSWKPPIFNEDISCSARSRWREPNPGIKRPTVTVSRPPPPPPPPPTL